MIGDEHGFGWRWNRRDFLTIVAGGAASLAIPRGLFATQDSHVIEVWLMGAFIATKGDANDGAIEILIPKASGHSKHEDKSPANKHAFRAAWPEQPGGTKLKETKLPKTGITLIGAPNNNHPALAKLIQLENVLPPGTVLLEDEHGEWSRYWNRVTLVGGSFSLIQDSYKSMWSIPDFNGAAVGTLQGILGIKWEPNKDNVPISWTGEEPDIPTLLTVEKHPLIVFAQSKKAIRDWGKDEDDSHRPKPGDVDHDFKWLYRCFAPKDHETEETPWEGVLKGQCFPAPVCESGGSAPPSTGPGATSIEIVAKTLQVGSPTCFGGCFGC
jgi:hypothetical protein